MTHNFTIFPRHGQRSEATMVNLMDGLTDDELMDLVLPWAFSNTVKLFKYYMK